MAQYPSLIGQPNPFFTQQPIVLGLRYVRVIPATGEVVVEDANRMPRKLMRIDSHRVHPQRTAPRTIARNIPDNETRKIAW